jgi:hypothetical protein
LYAAAKDNSMLVQYDLGALVNDPEAGCPPGEVVFDASVFVQGAGMQQLHGQSALAERDGWLYVAYRTSSVVIRIKLSADGTPSLPVVAQKLAQLDPYDPTTRKSANITDMAFDSRGRLYIVSANGGVIHRFQPDPKEVYDGRTGKTEPWLRLGKVTNRAKMKCENILIDNEDRVYITSGDGYSYQQGADGTVYRLSKVD